MAAPLILSGAEGFPSLASEDGAPRRDLVDAPRETRPARPRTAPPSRPPTDAKAAQAPRAETEKLCIIARAARDAAPPFPRDLEWVRTSGMAPEDAMRGRVVLIEVWESSCINCLRNLPILSRLHKRYAAFGLVVLGIHSSEYSFTASRWPSSGPCVASGCSSRSRRTHARPSGTSGRSPAGRRPTSLDDRGMLASMHTGELTASTMEKSIRALLIERSPGLRFPDRSRAAPGSLRPGVRLRHARHLHDAEQGLPAQPATTAPRRHRPLRAIPAFAHRGDVLPARPVGVARRWAPARGRRRRSPRSGSRTARRRSTPSS